MKFFSSLHFEHFNKATHFRTSLALLLIVCCLFFCKLGNVIQVFAQSVGLLSSSEGRGQADSLYREMLSSVEGATSISASVRQQLSLFGQEFIATGGYHELKTPELRGRKKATRFRLELTIPSPAGSQDSNSPNSLTIARDNTYQYIYRYTSIEGEKRLEKIDVKRLTETLEKQEHYAGPAEVGSMFGLGGLAGMLHSIRSQYDFVDAPVQTQINEKNGSIAVWKIRGRLKPEVVSALTGAANGSKSVIPRHTPTAIDIYVGVEDRFPFRFDYFWAADGSENGAENFGYLMFYNRVLHDRNISETIFDYQPSDNILPDEVTDRVIQRLLR